MDNTDWLALIRMLQDMGLVVTGINRVSGTITLRVPSLRETRYSRDDTIHEWSNS